MRTAAWLLMLLLSGCPVIERPPPPATRTPGATPPPFSPPAGFERLRMGLVPFLSKDTMLAANQKLAEYLSRALSVPVEVIVADDYGDAVERLARGEFELVMLSPLSYVEAAERVKLNCLVQTIADGSATASGYIFVREDSPRQTLEDLKGASFGFVDPMSTSGSLLAKKIFKERGLDVKRDFSRAEYLGNHEAVVLAVLDGRVEAGATYQGAFASLKRTHGVDPLSLRIIAKTPRTPRDILCLREEVPKEVGEAISAALLVLSGRDRAGREILAPMVLNGFQPANVEDYEPIRAAAREFGE